MNKRARHLNCRPTSETQRAFATSFVFLRARLCGRHFYLADGLRLRADRERDEDCWLFRLQESTTFLQSEWRARSRR